MKKLFLLLLLPLLAFTADNSISGLNGAYQQLLGSKRVVSTSQLPGNEQKVIRLFFEGYWAKLQYNAGKATVQGGRFTLNAGKYYQEMDYCLAEPVAAGTKQVFSYSLKDGLYSQQSASVVKGQMEEHFNKMEGRTPLQHTHLEGVWQLNGFALNDKAQKDNLFGMVYLKYYVYPRFLLVAYNASNGYVTGFAEGTYFYDYNRASVMETVETSSLYGIRAGQAASALVTLHDNSFIRQPTGESSPELWISATAR
jgi:hypothetical protein